MNLNKKINMNLNLAELAQITAACGCTSLYDVEQELIFNEIGCDFSTVEDIAHKHAVYRELREALLHALSVNDKKESEGGEKMLCKNKYMCDFTVKRVHCSGDVTVVIWADGSKTMVRCQNGEKFDPEKGIAMCFMKKAFGNKSNFNDAMKVMLDTAFEK